MNGRVTLTFKNNEIAQIGTQVPGPFASTYNSYNKYNKINIVANLR